MPGLAGLALADGDCPGLAAEIARAHLRQFAIAATREQSGANNLAERPVASVGKTPAFVIREEAHNRRVGFAEGLHLAPSVIARDTAFMKSVVQRGL